ncbi:MAG: tRNA pseudouridine(55) synthase TruB [Ruminococcaceae bacterium]|nr:tRNA pseudouridine(55) synthase TruB [Oscillospiraceae bacterium]
MTGILPIDKPTSITSHTVTSNIKRLTGEKCGHSGTLDPMATGVLPVLVGSATRLADFLATDKQYIAHIQLGTLTDTGDITGNVIENADFSHITKDDLLNAIKTFKGQIQQTPPLYSAIKVNGQKLCDIARKGLSADIPSRIITIYKIELLDYDASKGIFSLLVDCSKGTYIRTLAQDIGQKLSTVATLSALQRTVSCNIGIDKCISLDKAKTLSADDLGKYLITPEEYFSYLPKIILKENAVKYYSNGGAIALNRTIFEADCDLYCCYNPDGIFLGLCKNSEGSVKAIWSQK